MRLLLGFCLEIVSDVDGKDGQALMLDERAFVVPLCLEQFLLVVVNQLIGGFVRDECQEGNNPEGEFFIFDLEQQELNEIGFYDVVTGEDDLNFGVVGCIVSKELDEIFDGLFAVGPLDVGIDVLVTLLDSTHGTEALYSEEDLVV